MASRTKRAVARRRARPREPAWTRLSDEELLQKRFCDLRLTLRHSVIDNHIHAIRRDLQRRGIRFKPHVWLSEEWFSPDGVPGIAIAFYMAHPRLMRLERRMMDEVEGGNANWLTRIMRHEFAHALDNAYRLRRRKEWRETFGNPSQPYPEVYSPRPASRDFVLHLGHWYAQSHPTEDWAETFAVWMQPKARWRRDYQSWPVALSKLEYVDRLMGELAGQPPPVMNRELIEPIGENETTLGEHYRRKRARYDFDTPDAYDLRLKRVFGKHRQGRRMRASTFVRQSRPELERWLLRRSRLYPYLVHHVLRAVIQRCRELDLVLDTSKHEAKRALLGVLERILIDTLRRDRERYSL